MPTIVIQDLNINYIQLGNRGKHVVCMHGWKQNIEMMSLMANHLSNDFIVTVLDFPGFGESDEPKVSWGLEDYTTFFADFCDALNITDPILIGHSFGCRVATMYAIDHPVHKMVFTGGAGIKPKRELDYYLRTYTYKAAKQLFKLPGLNQYEEEMKKHFGSRDYKESTGVMRETFVKIVNSDTSDVLDKITMPVLLVWGSNDEETPLWMGKMMEEKMKNAGLAIFENDDHFAYWHQWQRFNLVLDAFLQEDKGV